MKKKKINESMKIFGIDIGGTTIKIGLFEENGTKLYIDEIPTNHKNNSDHIFDDIMQKVKDIINRLSLSIDDISGIGVALPGPVDKNGTVHGCVNLNMGVFNADEEMYKAIDKLYPQNTVSVCAINDANAAAYGEMWMGSGKTYSNIVYVTLGTGVGGAIISDGEIISGAKGAAGEIGHMYVVDDETDKCSCGKCGCLEQIASATGIVKRTQKKLKSSKQPSVLRAFEGYTSKEVFEAINNQDELALQVYEDYSKYLGKGLAAVGCVVNPEIIIFGGGMSKAGELVYKKAADYYNEYTFTPCRNVKFSIASLSNDAGAYGAAANVLLHNNITK